MPTGGGKSVLFQIPAMMNEGVCLVISPLVALMKDQVANLQKRNIKNIALTGGIRSDEMIDLLDNCQFGNIKFSISVSGTSAVRLDFARILSINLTIE
jgi:ATP-dependent DNA helicase RecQ